MIENKLEVIAQIKANNLAGKSIEISAEKARAIINKVYSIDLGAKIDRSRSLELLETLPEMSPRESYKFYLEVLKEL